MRRFFKRPGFWEQSDNPFKSNIEQDWKNVETMDKATDRLHGNPAFYMIQNNAAPAEDLLNRFIIHRVVCIP